MVQFITCKQCGGRMEMLNKIAITVLYKTYKRGCDHCNNLKNESYSFDFCSEKCFEEYYIHNTARVEPKAGKDYPQVM